MYKVSRMEGSTVPSGAPVLLVVVLDVLATNPDKLRSVSQVVSHPGDEGGIHLHGRQFFFSMF